jgi:hypothetical protein
MYQKTLVCAAVLFAGLVGVALAGSAPEAASSASCHGSTEVKAESGCHGAVAAESGCHGVSAASAERRSVRRQEVRAARYESRAAAWEARAAASKARAAASQSRVEAKSSCHGK